MLWHKIQQSNVLKYVDYIILIFLKKYGVTVVWVKLLTTSDPLLISKR
jgi:hypothetical protein